MIRASDLKDGLDVHLHPAVAGKELAAEALWDAVRRVLRGGKHYLSDFVIFPVFARVFVIVIVF